MTDSSTVILRYFTCRGRAQPLRDALSDAGVPFQDICVTDWRTRPQPASVAGLFASLPTLTWDGVEACETLPIARLVADRLHHTRGLSEQRMIELEAVCSAMYTDVMVPIAQVIWCDVLFPGADARDVTKRRVPRWVSKLERGAALLGDDHRFLGGDAPVVADFFLFEAFDAVRTLLGPPHSPRLERELPRLARLTSDMLGRPRFASCHARRPPRFTGRPDELEVLARVHECDPAELWPTDSGRPVGR
jgi:glutathione S-transferase